MNNAPDIDVHITTNPKILLENAERQKSVREIVGFCKGSAAIAATFLATNRVSVILQGANQVKFNNWLSVQTQNHPKLSGLIKVYGNVVKFAWDQIKDHPTLCATIISALVASGALIAYNVKKNKLNRDLRRGTAIVTEQGVYRRR
jgi:hypothetical protein